ncbi:OapA family protein [Hafnia paralvei]|uniref:OapA family protein n=1 Tax=Hafnia paralvei TaxID=546367 RepID=UPI003C2EE12F
MGRITPRRRRSTRVYQPILRTWLNLRQRNSPALQEPQDQETERPMSSKLSDKLKVVTQHLYNLWHMPDRFDWMEPLPAFHRRWVIVATVVLLLSLLWPYSDPQDSRYSSEPQQENEVPMQAGMNNNDAPPPPRVENISQAEQNGWQEYHIQAGQTLAQLFRDNQLNVNDVFAMAQVEGNDKPLSNLKAGQEVEIQHNAQGQVIALKIETISNEQIEFRREADGSFRRIR